MSDQGPGGTLCPCSRQAFSRLAAFSTGLALAAGSAAAIGAATGATPPFQDCLKVAAQAAGFGSQSMSDAGHGAAPMIEAVPGSNGLHAQVAGLWLAPLTRTVSAGATTTWRFRIIGCDGSPVRHFDRENTKLLHLIVVRTDLTGYEHVHPTLGSDGTFTVQLHLPRPGTYRAIADFVTEHRKYVLGTNLTAPGPVHSMPLPAPAVESHADGYAVELAAPRPARRRAGSAADLPDHASRPAGRRPAALPGLLRTPRRAAPPRALLLARPPDRREPGGRGDHVQHRPAPAGHVPPLPPVPGCRARAHRRLHPERLLNNEDTRKDQQTMHTTYSVPGISCGHCRTAITAEVTKIAGVSAVEVDIDSKTVTVNGAGFNDAAVRDAIDEAGYDIA